MERFLQWLERFKTPITVVLVIGLLAATGLLVIHTTMAQQLIARTTTSSDDKVLKDLEAKQQAILAQLANIKLDQPAGFSSDSSTASSSDTPSASSTDQASKPASSTSMSASSSVISGTVHLNTADAAALETLPDIGVSKAQAILDYRTAHGRFSSIDELDNVKGIGTVTLEKLKPYLTLD
mgnify:CR=1 FL=1